MLHVSSGQSNVSSTTITRLKFRVSSMTPRTKLIVLPVLLLSILFAVSAAAYSDTADSPNHKEESTGVTTQISTEAVNNVQLPEATADAGSGSQTSVRVNSSVRSNGSEAPTVEVEVNGQEIVVPENGQVSETITGPSDESTVHVDVHNSTSQTDGDDRTRIRIDSETESEVRIRER